MPYDASPYSSVPQFLSQPAQPPVQAGQGQFPDMPGGAPEAREPDIFERVVMLIMSNPTFWVPMLAGLGLDEVFKKSGKFSVKPHRSNEELAQQGMPTGIPGQTGQPSPEQLLRQIRPPGMPQLGGMTGFPAG